MYSTWMHTREIIFTKCNHQYMLDAYWWKISGIQLKCELNFQWGHALVLIVGKIWNTHLSVQVMMIVFVLLEMTQIFHSVVMNHLQTDLFPDWGTPLVQFSPSSLSFSPHLVVHSWSHCRFCSDKLKQTVFIYWWCST